MKKINSIQFHATPRLEDSLASVRSLVTLFAMMVLVAMAALETS